MAPEPTARMQQAADAYRATGSLAAAATLLGVTPSAVGHLIREYERRIGQSVRPPVSKDGVSEAMARAVAAYREAGTIAAAAARLGVTPGAVWMALTRYERRTGQTVKQTVKHAAQRRFKKHKLIRRFTADDAEHLARLIERREAAGYSSTIVAEQEDSDGYAGVRIRKNRKNRNFKKRGFATGGHP